MTNPKHTPGPWKVRCDRCHFDTASDIYAGDKLIAQSCASYPEIEANAHLIAAAPELLEALREARGWVDLAEDLCADNSKALAMIDAIIAKAEGRS